MSRQERSGARRYRPHEGTAVGRKVADQATLAAWVVPGIEQPAPTVEGRATVTGGDAIKIGRHGMDVHAKTGSTGHMSRSFAPTSPHFRTVGARHGPATTCRP